ncbi:flavin reductase [Catenulispora sp. NF23]|uniref:Flavin reductase n=1 Tax=Catenulispora pinistramenti TaxID=2705254 RepID=A0ABS5KNA0_9ACTN|nr:flavin reductase family protein [Catenulispora pinistramenti]MBS2532819.1 flavin reductase [Catenulispora pinistramenti]MBS2547496.1 flavin reductase [Catenulispora pinistramenti]
MTLFTTNQDLSPDALREVFGAFPSGVVALIAFVADEPVGLAASSFTSVSLDPPLVSVSIANGSKTWPELRAATYLGITVLAEQHRAFARQLAGPVDSRFDGIPLARAAEGSGFVVDGLAHFNTSVYREVEAGDHTIALLRVHARAAAAEGQPLVFHRSGFRTLAA